MRKTITTGAEARTSAAASCAGGGKLGLKREKYGLVNQFD